jgi:hypothetical protein
MAHGVALALVLLGCNDGHDGNDAGDDGAALYPRVRDILERSCAYERCHAGALIGGQLALPRGGDFAAALVSVTACEYDRMARVEPFDPDNSWLWVKLTADFRDPEDPVLPFYIHFEPEPGWDPDVRGCPDRADDGTPLFGQRMPLTAPNMLPEDELAVIREWIARGARR